MVISLEELCKGLPTQLDQLSQPNPRDNNVPHAPVRNAPLTPYEKKLAIKNALRYFPSDMHRILIKEFTDELNHYGHIYMYRFRPDIEMRAYPIDKYPGNCQQARAIMLMIMNNLDTRVAQFPHELVTYGGNGQVFSNWAQFMLVMHYLSIMTEDQTLVLYSGHPLGLFPSTPSSPRVVITNGMVIPNYSSRTNYDRMFALGVTLYGQMTAGSFSYIGPQGIVHGTTLTILNAGRKYLGLNDLKGKVFLSSGLGGMSGAQAKAAVICGCIGVIAEVNHEALEKRYKQGWVVEVEDNIDRLIQRIRMARQNKEIVSIGYHGNIVDIWERMVQEFETNGERLVDLGSDQTSCHNPFNGGYYPVQLTFQEAQKLMHDDPFQFKTSVEESMRRHVEAVNKMSAAGMFFFDYGNAFLLEADRAGADVKHPNDKSGMKFRYPSYVQDIMGDIFSLGFGPFRWVCTSCDSTDLKTTDNIAAAVLEAIIEEGVSEKVQRQYEDNIHWIRDVGKHSLVVGSEARILYSDQVGRTRIALAFNLAVQDGCLKGPIVISRDHHDVSGTDSPFRETSNVYDGSAFTADMAVQNCIGDAFRGATWVALHNGGGVGWGEVVNGGFGLVLDGTKEAAERAENMLLWDVCNGVARRCWSGNSLAKETALLAMQKNQHLKVTLPFDVEDPTLTEATQ